MKAWIIGLALGLSASTFVAAQQPAADGAAPAAGPTGQRGASATGAAGGGAAANRLRPPNISNMPGTDSGFGMPCDQLTMYGETQPAGWPAVPYGKGAGKPGPAYTLPAYVAPAPAGENSVLGAAGPGKGAESEGAKARGLVIPEAPTLPFKFVDQPEAPRGSPGWANVNGVGMFRDGHLLITQREPMFEIMEYGQDGKLLRAIDPNLLARPHGLRVDKEDNIWITDQSCNTVVKINRAGNVLLRLGVNGEGGVFSQPTDVAIASNGDIFVSNSHGQGEPKIVRFDKTGKFIKSWSMAREGKEQTIIHTLVINKKDEVFVGDRETHLIKVYNTDGKPLRTIQMQNLICELYIDSKDQLWMTTGMDGMVLKLDWNGKILGKIGQLGWEKNEFGEAHFMSLSPDGKTMWVTDTVNNNVKKLERIN